MGIIPYLPKGTGEVLGNLKMAGEWEARIGEMKKLSEELDVESEATKDALTAIPTALARPQLFAEALVSDEHPLRNEVTNEWKGLLGICCFKGKMTYSVEIEPVDLEQDTPTKLQRVLRSERVASSRIYLIRVDNVLVGGTSFGTKDSDSIVFTAPEYSLPPCIPWEEHGMLMDPAKYFKDHGMFENLCILGRWLESFKDQYKNFPVSKVLQAWSDYIARESLGHTCDSFKVKSLSAEVPAPYSFVLSYADIAPAKGRSDFAMSSPRITGGDTLVVWEEGWQDGNRIVWDTIQAKTVRQALKSGKEKMGTVLTERGITCGFVMPFVDFFTEKALRLPVDEDKVYSALDCGLVPPLRKEILHYFAGEQVSSMFRWEESSKGMVAILSIPLKPDTCGAERSAEIRRTYRAEDIVEIGKRVPIVAIWPDFQADDWHWYYMISEKTKNGVEFEPVTSQAIGQGGKSESEGTQTVAESYRVWRKDTCIEAVECSCKSMPIGLILPQFAGARAVSGEEWQVAVDFGTVNTTVCVKRPTDHRPEVLRFDDRSLCLTAKTYSDPPTFLSRFFMPRHDGGSLTSILWLAVAGLSNDLRPVHEAVVLHIDTNPAWPALLIQDQVEAGLKWTTDVRKRRLMITFLEHLLLLVTAESRARGINRLRFCASFPSAFPSEWRREFQRNWSVNARDMLANGGFIIPDDGIRFETESMAVCKDSRTRLGQTIQIGERIAVCVMDIGGGTTDIGVWTRTERGASLIAQASVLLAGGVLSDYALAVGEFWKDLRETAASKDLRTDTTLAQMPEHKNARVLVPAAVNTLLKTNHDAVLKEVLINASAKFLRARSIILFSYGALFYYAGLIIRALSSEKSFAGCNVLLAGNGAQLLQWIGNDADLFTSLSEFVYRGAKFSDAAVRRRIDINLPQRPKEEVASGLLIHEDFDESREPRRIIGESGYTYKGASLDWFRDMNEETEVFSHESVQNVRQVRVPEKFPELREFTSVYNQEAARQGLEKLIEVDPVVIQDVITGRIGAIADGSADSELLQPFFIEEVRAVIDMYLK